MRRRRRWKELRSYLIKERVREKGNKVAAQICRRINQHSHSGSTQPDSHYAGELNKKLPFCIFEVIL
jgi:hypothetical protein